jgi:hypothetical protein
VLVGIWKLAVFAQPLVRRCCADGRLGPAAAFTRRADDAATVVRVLWDVLLQPVATYVSILAISLALACALLWTQSSALPWRASQR